MLKKISGRCLFSMVSITLSDPTWMGRNFEIRLSRAELFHLTGVNPGDLMMDAVLALGLVL